jgi:hypothetical protein
VTEIWFEGEERVSRQAESLLLNGHDIAFVPIGLADGARIKPNSKSGRENTSHQEEGTPKRLIIVISIAINPNQFAVWPH